MGSSYHTSRGVSVDDVRRGASRGVGFRRRCTKRFVQNNSCSGRSQWTEERGRGYIDTTESPLGAGISSAISSQSFIQVHSFSRDRSHHTPSKPTVSIFQLPNHHHHAFPICLPHRHPGILRSRSARLATVLQICSNHNYRQRPSCLHYLSTSPLRIQSPRHQNRPSLHRRHRLLHHRPNSPHRCFPLDRCHEFVPPLPPF
jgi:hypothetical protein